MNIINSELKVKASKKLEEEILAELEIQDSDEKTSASIIEENLYGETKRPHGKRNSRRDSKGGKEVK